MQLEGAVPREILAAIRAPFLAEGATPLDAPVIQPLGLFLDLAGEALRERLFIVQAAGGEEACLRPDFTIAAVRAHIAAGGGEARYLYEGHAFRVAPPGAARAEEFLQIGLERFEPGDAPVADAATAALAWRAASAGGREDLALLLGDVALFDAFIDQLALAGPLSARLKRAFSTPRRLRAELAASLAGEAPAPRGGDRLAGLLAGVSESEAAAVLEDIWALAGIEPVGGRSAREITHRLAERQALARSPRLTDAQHDLIARFLAIADTPGNALTAVARLAGGGAGPLAAALEAWRRRLDELSALRIPAERMTLSTRFGRAFSYYDGVFFEIHSAALGDEAPVAAGGRYDRLPGRLGATGGGGAVGCIVRPGRAWKGGQP